MKKHNLLIALILIPSFIAFGWGDKGHKIITKYALNLLDKEFVLSADLKMELIKHCTDPDYRKKEDPAEPNKHFIDIDFYKEFLNGRMIHSFDTLVMKYGDSVVTKQGTLPWATFDSYRKLVEAIKNKNREKIILYGSDLAHYVGDGHQPMHATLNYNGQLTSQKGIHFRYEIEMIDRNLNEIESRLEKIEPMQVKNMDQYVFDYITESNFFVDMLLSADKYSYSLGLQKYEDEYYRLLWFRTKYVTVDCINQAAATLASFYYSAWIEAGKPVLDF